MLSSRWPPGEPHTGLGGPHTHSANGWLGAATIVRHALYLDIGAVGPLQRVALDGRATGVRCYAAHSRRVLYTANRILSDWPLTGFTPLGHGVWVHHDPVLVGTELVCSSSASFDGIRRYTSCEIQNVVMHAIIMSLLTAQATCIRRARLPG